MAFKIRINKDNSTIKTIDDFSMHLNKHHLEQYQVLYFLTKSNPDIDLTKNFFGNQYISYIEIFDMKMNLIYETNYWNYSVDVWDNGTWIREIFYHEEDPEKLKNIYPKS